MMFYFLFFYFFIFFIFFFVCFVEKKIAFSCSVCLDLFISRKKLYIHQKSFHNKDVKCQVFKCDFEGCGKTFSMLSKLNRHKKIHLLLYQCSVCGKRFGEKSNLKVHERIHKRKNMMNKNEGIYQECPYCKKRFTDASSKNKHVRTMHGGSNGTRVKNFVCSKCHRSFAQLSICWHCIVLRY